MGTTNSKLIYVELDIPFLGTFFYLVSFLALWLVIVIHGDSHSIFYGFHFFLTLPEI
ncbi:hypothetical protein Lalb_Chr15g0076041 [Lupinus albus]|uniref:Uncharacterized protein n=1 Tax=Lupinus albus TaxID=3870 RepID=A0A6A4NZM9_LUPAL|nr:hypothetical protein Lalb_Chr15g0076041 [Lupinus albus]